MWQALQSAIESPDDSKQRKSITQNNPESALLAAGMPKNILTALNMMRLLVEAEEKNGSLKDKLNTSWAVEESLRDQILRLETKLNIPQEILLADIQKIQTTVEIINKRTSDVTRLMNTQPEATGSQQLPTESSDRKYKAPIPLPGPIPVLESVPAPILKKQSPKPGILRKLAPQGTNSPTTSPAESPTASRISLGITHSADQEPWGPIHYRYPSTPTPTKQLMSPPTTPSVLPEPLDRPSLFGQTSHVSTFGLLIEEKLNLESGSQMNRWKSAHPQPNNTLPGGSSNEQAPHPPSHVVSKHLSMHHETTSRKLHPGHFSMHTPSIPHNNANPVFAQLHSAPTPAPTQPSLAKDASMSAIPNSTSVPISKPQLQPRTLTVLFDFSGTSSTELILRNGQKLQLLPESDTNKEWIWCLDETGKTGYAPRSYVTVDDI
ncbi:hypothetical protein RHS04_08689 [Rhizoctonia solani]|uniref:SH3 domain-containing protein n=1 Tax=Rhizoctonia solani TaxID=456999 RepID=A0A8H7H134_9AGAM|nr:hypothetical protein RHS04_08689 [Rhizoctonia solani]